MAKAVFFPPARDKIEPLGYSQCLSFRQGLAITGPAVARAVRPMADRVLGSFDLMTKIESMLGTPDRLGLGLADVACYAHFRRWKARKGENEP